VSRRELATAHVRFAAACAVVLSSAACGPRDAGHAGAETVVVLHESPGAERFGAVEVHGVDATTLDRVRGASGDDVAWSEILTVRTPGAASGILGRYELTDDGIRFTPRFAPVAGQPWEVRYAPAHGMPVDTVLLVATDAGSVATRIVAVDPGIDTVPMNLLRAYVRFSAPMSEGEAYDRIRLLDANGDTVADAFLVLENELWDRERTRFTLLFDPGRIKRGLVPNETLGLPLREGNDYTLVIDGGWTDAHGRALGAAYRWSFHAGPADRASPRVEEWTIVSPSTGGRAPLTISTGEPLDRALLERLLELRDAEGTAVDGEVAVSESGSRWRFTPAVPWQPGDYESESRTELVDLAGNNLRHLCDVGRSDRQATGVTAEVVRCPLSSR
jgi:hypothetical protein